MSEDWLCLPLPGWGKVCAALGADEGDGLLLWGLLAVRLQYPAHRHLQAHQIQELGVVGVRDEVHLGGRGLGRRDLGERGVIVVQ